MKYIDIKSFNVVLASGSPRRIEMFRNHGIDVRILPADIDESLPMGIRPQDAVMFLSLKKALYVENIILSEAGENSTEKPTIIVAADTVVALENDILGKPEDEADAFRMLDDLRGRTHYVTTGVAVVEAGNTLRKVFCDRSDVEFVNYTDEDIKAYIATGEPMDKAGAYAIQGGFGKYVKEFRGSRDNIIGFPWEKFESEILGK